MSVKDRTGRQAHASQAQILSSLGYRDVANVLGGFGGMPMRDEGRVEAGLPVESEAPSGQSYGALLANARRDR